MLVGTLRKKSEGESDLDAQIHDGHDTNSQNSKEFNELGQFPAYKRAKFSEDHTLSED